MILFDAVHINNGGGKVLLDFIKSQFDKSKLKVFYLLDDRIKNSDSDSTKKIRYINAGFFSRLLFYILNRKSFNSILCFNNIPPYINVNAIVYTYFHNVLLLECDKNISFFDKLKFKFKKNILRYFSKNTNFWIVQSERVRFLLSQELSIDINKIYVLPFWEKKNYFNCSCNKLLGTYFYPSNAQSYKNHLRLIAAFCKFYDKFKYGKLILTVSENYTSVYNEILTKIKSNYPIINIGFVDSIVLIKYYSTSEYVIFPSYYESLGLGIIEGINYGCKIIASDLPYVYQVCTPSIVFNPFDEYSIIESFEQSINSNISTSHLLLENSYDKIIKLFVS